MENDTLSSVTPNDPPVSDDRFWAIAVIQNGKIKMLVEGYPPGEAGPHDIPLTKSEFYFLRSLPPQFMDMRKLRTMAGRIQTKINKASK